jgi:hypothetical protein
MSRSPWKMVALIIAAASLTSIVQADGGSRPAASGVLAGRVVDTLGRKPPKSYIQLIELGARPVTASINVVADDNGFFSIQGLEEKGHYSLIVRARDGEKLLAGQIIATASQRNLVVKISDLVVADTPDVPAVTAPKAPEASDKKPAYDGVIDKWSFQIPFVIPPDRQREIQAVELLVSTDEGKIWQPVAKVQPDANKFEFTAPKEGVYWFSVALIDMKGNREPDTPSSTSCLKLLVKQSRPSAAQQSEQLQIEIQKLRTRLRKLEKELADQEGRKGSP